MSFDWAEYLALAQELAKPGTEGANQEARLRSAISRAYYAAFCKARNHLRDKDHMVFPPNADAHKLVADAFRNSRLKVRKRIGWDLIRLRLDRRKADYDDEIRDVARLAKTDMRLARHILSTLDKL